MEPRLRDMDVDAEDRIVRHRELLLSKGMTREVFFELYDLLHELDRRFLSGDGDRIEVGAGSSLLKHRLSDVQSTDVVPFPELDRVVDAMDMPYDDQSLRTIFAIHCFHHLPDPYKFIHEIDRTCAPGGGAVLVEPYYGPAASLIYRYIFSNEYFDKEARAVTSASGPMSEANQALSYIVFERDVAEFSRRFPNLEIAHRHTVGNYIRYLVSGGVNFRQLLPDYMSAPLSGLEHALKPLSPLLALHHVIVIRKKADDRR